MMRDNLKLISGAIATGIYLVLIGVILYYFNYRSTEKAIHYVKKNSDAIAISLSGTKAPAVKEKSKKNPQDSKAKHKAQKVRNITTPKETSQKSKKAKKMAKKIQAKRLFSSVHTPKTIRKKSKKSNKRAVKPASERVVDSLKKQSDRDKGVENAYFASIQQRLEGWPEQANFAGEQISVLLTVYRSGKFDFNVQHLSSNSEFNEALIAYLKQLQSIGLGRHTNSKAYRIEVEFVATE